MISIEETISYVRNNIKRILKHQLFRYLIVMLMFLVLVTNQVSVVYGDNIISLAEYPDIPSIDKKSPFQADGISLPAIKTYFRPVVYTDKFNETNLINKSSDLTGFNSSIPAVTTASLSKNQISAICTYPYSHDKKIIEFGCDAPAAIWVKNNIASMEKKPFDGVAFVPGMKHADIWQPDDWRKNPKYLDTISLSAIKWNKFKGNNFLILFCNRDDSYNLNYWDDEKWIKIEANMKALAKAAHDYGCAGILFDIEYYNTLSPWNYSVNNNGHTLAETQNKIRKRGAQVMKAWQSQYPDITILCTDLTTDDPNYDLLPYWVNGILDVIGSEARLVEGDENSYYLAHTNDWFNRYDEFKISKSMLSYLDPANNEKWTKNVEKGNALYWEWVNKSGYPLEVQNRWEHNAYMGMVTSDKWVWTYSNTINWWGVPIKYQPINDKNTSGIPDGAIEGITNAKKKFSTHKMLGWDLKNFIYDSSVKVDVTNTKPVTVTSTTSNGIITNIDFYLNSVLVKSDTSVPYSLDAKNVPAGKYTLIARGRVWRESDKKSFWGTSQPVDITLPFPALKPVIKSVSPHSRFNSINAAVKITGTNFKNGAVVKLTKGSITKKGIVTQIKGDQIKCNLPIKGMTKGMYNLSIINTDGMSTKKLNAFAVKAAGAKPTITKLSFKSANNSVSKQITITGTNFRSNIAVSINKGATVKALTGIKRISSSKITCTLPKGLKTGYWNLTVKNSDETSATKTNAIHITGKSLTVKTSNDHICSDPVTRLGGPLVLNSITPETRKTTDGGYCSSSTIILPKMSGLKILNIPHIF